MGGSACVLTSPRRKLAFSCSGSRLSLPLHAWTQMLIRFPCSGGGLSRFTMSVRLAPLCAWCSTTRSAFGLSMCMQAKLGNFRQTSGNTSHGSWSALKPASPCSMLWARRALPGGRSRWSRRCSFPGPRPKNSWLGWRQTDSRRAAACLTVARGAVALPSPLPSTCPVSKLRRGMFRLRLSLWRGAMLPGWTPQ